MATAFFLHVDAGRSVLRRRCRLFGAAAETLIAAPRARRSRIGGVLWMSRRPSAIGPPAHLLRARRHGGCARAIVGLALGFALSTMTSLLTSAGETHQFGDGLLDGAQRSTPRAAMDAAVVGAAAAGRSASCWCCSSTCTTTRCACSTLDLPQRCPVGQTFDDRAGVRGHRRRWSPAASRWPCSTRSR
jgi:hypothetical protein